jgi:hypothetical protein
MASRSTRSDEGGGCLAFFLIILVVGLIVMAIISLAAAVDPFDWMPRVGQIWADCSGDCALAHRFPGFWWHAVANLIYAGVAVAAACAFIAAVADLREARVARYDDAAAAAAFTEAHNQCVGAGALLAALAGLPILVAIL